MYLRYIKIKIVKPNEPPINIKLNSQLIITAGPTLTANNPQSYPQDALRKLDQKKRITPKIKQTP